MTIPIAPHDPKESSPLKVFFTIVAILLAVIAMRYIALSAAEKSIEPLQEQIKMLDTRISENRPKTSDHRHEYLTGKVLRKYEGEPTVIWKSELR